MLSRAAARDSPRGRSATSSRYGPKHRSCNVARRAGGGLLALLAFVLGVLGAMVDVGKAGAADAAEPLRLMVLGDSLTAGYGLARTDSFPTRLEQALREEGYDVTVINAGVSGDTTAAARARLPWVLGKGATGLPDAVMVELGANDGLRGLDPEAAYANLDAILSELRARGLPVLLTGMKAPPNLGAEYGRDFEAVFTRLAEKHDLGFYPFFLDGVAAVPALNQADGIHPNRAGMDEIVRRILPATSAFLDTVRRENTALAR